MEKVFVLNQYSTYIAEKTLQKVEDDVKKYRALHSKDTIYLDFSNTQLQDIFLKRVAIICAYYDCECLHLGERTQEVLLYQQTGYFIEQSIGTQAFIHKFKQLVEQADYPLLLWDQRGKSFFMKRIAVIQPLIFTDTHFIFRELNLKYVQPKDLVHALNSNKQDIFKRYEVHLTDINTKDYCFRFANDLYERSVLDILEGILTNTLPIFTEADVSIT